MTQAFADARIAPLSLGAGRSPLERHIEPSALVRPLALAIAGLFASAGLAVIVTPRSSAAAAAVTQAPSPAAASAAPLRLMCAPTFAGAGSAFNATFAVNGGATNVVQWQIDYGDGSNATSGSLPAKHTYTEPGVYLAHVTATAAGGTTSTSSCVTQWLWVPPSA